ncbi:MAG: hypothetical protein JXD22_09750 [Sedimentisphaerales bacterium]|nr:hypothetical protein [Sedimentisphaerales bacterium]
MGGFVVIFEESWGKVGDFLQKVAIFKKGLSRFWPHFERGKISIRYSFTMIYADYR